MAVPEIIGSTRSTYTRVVRMVCEEKGIDYRLTEAPLQAPEIRAIHPFGKMPVLRHGDLALCESKAIATWLDRSFPAPFVFPPEPRLSALTSNGSRWSTPCSTAPWSAPTSLPISRPARRTGGPTGQQSMP